MWTVERRKAASEQAIARWADTGYKERQGRAIAKTPHCPSCGESDISKFYVDEKGRRTNKACKKCCKVACKERWRARSWLDRWASRNYKYGVTKEFLLDLYAKHEGKCAICRREPTTERGLHIDHCHKTGIVRGLLCHGCNVGIGALQEDPDIFNNALNYLKGNSHGQPQHS